ncbi:FadR/GntR family transcriptional regulator [Amycolatopsis ultiminotia]|uniref:FadR/GntR family transcriptional regulator n=1 Tax=Amycolatopsis ultiminotia TaxID=543629 RepID=A0ABP6V389_9PSEU
MQQSQPGAAESIGDGRHAFTPVARAKRGYEYIAEQVRDAIATRRYKPGDRLPTEREMAEIFEVSRNGVREAIRSLESSGLVEIRIGVHGGVFVAAGDPQTVSRSVRDLASLGALPPENVLEARILLTSDVLRLACERATEEDLKRIEDDILVTEREVLQPGAQRTFQITRFYRLLAEATHNKVLVILTDSLAQAVHVRLLRGGPPVNRRVGELRRRIVGYIRAGDSESAIGEITRHLIALEESMATAERVIGA